MGSHCSQGPRIWSIQGREYDFTGGASGAASQPERPGGGCVRDDSGTFDTWIGLDDRFAWMIMDATQV